MLKLSLRNFWEDHMSRVQWLNCQSHKEGMRQIQSSSRSYFMAIIVKVNMLIILSMIFKSESLYISF